MFFMRDYAQVQKHVIPSVARDLGGRGAMHVPAAPRDMRFRSRDTIVLRED
jgi:hypothetical protein